MMFSWLVVFCIYLGDFAEGSKPLAGCGKYPIGLQHKSIIPDSSFTSLTLSESTSTVPSSGRLHNTYAWMPEKTISYLQIDFRGERIVCGVATQGNPNIYSWVSRYNLSFSRNGTNWNTYKENGTDKIFQGNSDSSTVVRRYLKEVQTARYIRFIPTEYHYFISMRVEVFASDLEGPYVTPHQRSLQLKWGIMNGQVTSFLIEIRNKTAVTQFTLSNTTLEYDLTNLKPYTEYSIRLNVSFTNKPNLMSNWINVTTKSAVPECSPVVTNIQAASSTSINVAWQQDSTCLNGMLRGYIIQYRVLGNSTAHSINITDDRLTADRNVSGLRKYTNYSFRILAYTIGEGPLSKASVIKTGEDAPSCSPTLLSARTTSSTSVRLTWEPPPDNGCRNGVLQGFQIGYRPTSDKGYPFVSTKELKIDNPSTTTYELGGLKEYTWYNFSILAYTVARGPWSNALKNRTGEGAPSCSPDMQTLLSVNSTSIEVKWTPLPTSCRVGILRGYRLVYRILDSQDKPLTIDIRNPNATEKIVVGLKKFTNYSFQVLAYTAEDGNLSKPEFGKTKEDVPECFPVVTNIQAASSTSINVAWQQDSTCLNGILRGYIIQYRVLGNSTAHSINITDDRLTADRNVSGLCKYTNYSFRILAYTIGEGPLSKASVVRTGEDAPSCSPTLLSAEATSSTSVRLTWEPPPDNGCRNGILQGYTITYGSLYLTYHDPHAADYNLTGLDKYTWYTFSLQAFTVASSPTSNTLRNRTNEDAPDCSPTLASVLNVSSTSLHVTWTPLPRGKCRNGVLRGYKIYYNNTRTGKRLAMRIEENVTTTVNITGLSKYTEYSIRVLGYTVEDGPLSNEMTRRTSEDAPDCSPEIKYIEVFSSTSIRVSWNRLSSSPCTNGMVRGYKVRYQRTGGDLQTYQIRGAGSTTTDIVGLQIFTSYTFKVLAYTVTDGPPSDEYKAQTLADAPSAPVNVNRTLLPANGSVGPRIEIRWDEPLEKNGVIQKYTLVHMYNKDKAKEKKREIRSKFKQRTYLHTIDVIAETTFSFKVNAYTIKEGPYQNGEDLVIPAYPPSNAPSNISRTEINDTTFLLQWRPIPRHESNGNVTKYEVRSIMTSRGRTHRTKRSVVYGTRNAFTGEPWYILTGLLSCAQYNISVRGYTTAGHGPYSTPINVNTSQPESPFDVSVMKTDATSVVLEWKKPANVIERIDKYLIEYRGHKTYMHKYKTGGNATTNGRTEIRMNNLLPATHYEFWVSAATVCGKSPRSNSTTTQTSVTNPLAPNVASIQQYHKTGVSVNVTLFSASPINGPISAYQVIVEFLKRNNTHFDQLPPNAEQNAYSYPLADKNHLDYYITAEVKSDWLTLSRQLTIGDNMTYSKFRNVPLKKGARYHIYQRAVTNDKKKLLYSKGVLVANISIASDVVEETKALVRDSSGSETVVGIVVGLMLLIILVIVVVYFVWKRQRNVKKEDIQNMSLPLVAISPEQNNSTNAQAAETGEPIKPIHVSNFAIHMASMRKDDFSKLLQQFKTIPSTHVFSCIAARKPTNKCKNRYGNIVAYDHSRVKLQRIKGDEDSDYINASFMHGYDGTQKTYIATQGPLTETTSDFWRMIWEQNTTCIIMLTNLIELGKRKCHQYWPETSERYGDITVKIYKTEVFADYHIRTLLLSKGTDEEISRRVLHFHYTAWPDKGVPHNAAALLSFRRKVREISKWNTGPTVIHCSAGVGRTGTYMIVDAMLEQVESKKTIDIYNYTTLLRKNRSYMVQTSEQYVFIHMALLEEITCGNTEIEASDLETAMCNLSCTDNEENLSGYALEFQRLEFVASYKIKEECGVGQEEENAKKNRYPDIIPANQSRVILSTDDSNQEDYINATFIDTHRERNAFIMTQAPMENTIADFWRMVMDYDIGTVIMLNNLQEGDEEFPQYWSQEEAVAYSGIQVELLETEEYDDILLRTFTVSNQSAQHSVQHFQYTGWDNKYVPSNTQSLLNLFEMIWKSQQKCGNRPVVVQCSNGVGRSGTFCAIASCLERVKQEQVLDVFQTIKSIRVNRPGAVETLLQYEYCFIALKHYLNSFSDYANFTAV